MEQLELVKHVIAVFENLQIPYMIVGSVASGIYGEPRFTYDTDIVADLRYTHIDPLLAAFPEPQYYLSRNALVDAIRFGHQFNVIEPATGCKIDVMIAGGNAIQLHQLQRSRRLEIFPGVFGMVAAPEDVIIGKLRYYREGKADKHLRDIAGMLKILGQQVDCNYIEDWASRIGLNDAWQAALNRLNQT